MVNKRFLVAALLLSCVAASAGLTPVVAQEANGYVDPGAGPEQFAAVPITVNAGWTATTTVPPAFFWSGTPPVFADDNYTFSVGSAACVSVTDDFLKGDQFTVYDSGNAIGTTPLVPVDNTSLEIGPDAAYADPTYSSGTFVIGAGAHDISIEVIPPNSFDSGRGYIRVDTLGNFQPCDDLLLPDLVISSITHSPANPDTETQIEFTATVENAGPVSAGASTLSFKIGGESPSDPDALFAIPSLAPGETAAVTRFQTLGVAQNYTNTAVADFNDDVAESDETNNTATDSYTVTEAIETSGVVYSILTLPTNGTLFDSTGTEITVAGQAVPDTILTYEPDPGFEGVDFFTYRCTDVSTGLFDDATVEVIVSSAGSGVTLTVEFEGTGSGDVTLDVGGSVVAFCSSDCTEPFGPGDIVKLQARPLGLSTFGGWGGACSIAGSSQIAVITLPASGNTTCTATFNAP